MLFFGTYCTDNCRLVCPIEVYPAVFTHCYNLRAFTHDPGAWSIVTRVVMCSGPTLGN